MATLGLSKVFILDKYFTELQKFWETEKKLQDASSNEAVHLQQRLKSLSTELVTLRNRLHVGQVAGAGGVGGAGGQGASVLGQSGQQPPVIPANPTGLSTTRNAQGQMIICPNSAEFANNKLYGSSATAALNNATNCHNSTFPPPPPPTPAGAGSLPTTAAASNTNNSSSAAGHNSGLANNSPQQQPPGGHNKNGGGAAGGKSYVPVVSPRTTSMHPPGLHLGLASESVLPHAQQQQMPPSAMPHSAQSSNNKHHLLSPPLPVPSTGNNHFSPIQSPMSGGCQIPGLPVIHNGQLHSSQHQALAYNSMNSRMSGARAPPKVNHQNPHQQPMFTEEMQKAATLSSQSRSMRPKPSGSYSAQQPPAEGETQIEVIEHRQRKERLPLKDIEDLIHLSGPLTEDAVMKTLHTRFQNDSFYTNVGPILLAINPYLGVGNPLTLTSIRSLPLAAQMKKIVQETVRQQTETGYPQAIILSGTSGSGKTHCSMLLLRQLFDVAGGGHETDAFKHLAAAFTVLRSLGSAKTATNSESSRIGQFIEVQVTDGALYRTKIHCYFLDQTRVIRPLTKEKNYHIFYQMLAGLSREERIRLNLEGYSVHNLNYLQSGDTCQNEAEDAMRFQAWKTCLGILGIPFLDVVRVLSAVLLLGNVQFIDGLGLEVDVKGEAELNAVADLLGVPAQALFRGLTTRTHNARGQLVKSVCDANMSNMTRDCLSKALYCRTVATIVRRANSLKRLGSTLGTLSSDSNESVHNQAEVASQHASTLNGGGGGNAGSKSMAALNNAVRHATDGFIGILDMFGFEEPRPSHLEHLCINLCAETMQHFYNTHIFKSSVESCRDEGIYCDTEIDYVDNVPCIDLISSLRTGLLSMLDTCSVRGTAESYVAKIKVQHRNSTRLETKTGEPGDPRMFMIRHFAGRVEYDCSSFLDTNRDVVPDDLVSVFYKSICNFGFVTHLFGSELKALYAFEHVPRGLSFRIAPTSHTDVLNGDEPVSTLTQDFHTRLDNLLRTLVHARPHFVRCIRSNCTETPKQFDRSTIIKQIRSLQVLETVNLMASGFPHRMRFKQFNARYRMLASFNQLKRCEEKVLEDCKLILQLALKNPPELSGAVTLAWAPGKRHIFLSEGIRQHLERMRSHIRTRSATMIQAVWRSWQLRRRVGGSGQQRTKKNDLLIGSMGNKSMNLLPISRMTNQMMTGTITRPRPQPIAGTPPPDPNEKCDSKIIQQTCTLFGLDLERPPPVPPSRSYTVTGNSKLSYPQIRLMKMNFPEDAAVGGQASEQLRKGEAVSVVGASERRGHLIVDHGGRQWTVPFQFMELVKSTDCISSAGIVGATSLASVDI